MKTILLTRDMEAMVDDADYERVSQFKWYAMHCMDRFYAARKARKCEQGRVVLLHRFLLDFPAVDVDHRNGNSLDNRRLNLRAATTSQNMANRKMHRNNTSGYRGVTSCGTAWKASIRHKHTARHLGYFSTPEEAARAYDTAARELFSEFASLNFPVFGAA